MKAKTANRIKLSLERGIPIEDPRIIGEVWENIVKHNGQALQDEFIKQIVRTKSVVKQILKGGANGKMTPKEVAKYLGISETNELVTRIMKEVSSNPLYIRMLGPVGKWAWKPVNLMKTISFMGTF